MNYKEIKSYEDACKVLGVQPISENAVAAFPAEDRKSMLAYHKMTIIARAINGGWKPDWNNRSQYKYYPVFYYENAGLSCANTDNAASATGAYLGSRLCFQTEAMSDYAAATFADLYTDFYCLPASVEKEESQQSNKQPGDFLKMATDIIETQLQPLAQEKKTRGVVLIACEHGHDGRKRRKRNRGNYWNCRKRKSVGTRSSRTYDAERIRTACKTGYGTYSDAKTTRAD